jgi:hypothetical protein
VQLLTDEVTTYLFVDKVATLDFASMSNQGFEFFEYFFRY